MDSAEELVAMVADCRVAERRIAIMGHGSKPRRVAWGHETGVEELSTRAHSGILEYRPEELVITAQSGTPLAELADAVAAQGQLLPFDPPRFGGEGTLGGAIASGLSGPARPWRGSIHDAVLGVELINGLGERLRFGGSVMKNVAGYDVSRLVVGSLGSLGVVLSASVRVLPAPAAEETVCTRCSASEADVRVRCWARRPLPITGTCYVDGTLSIRLSGGPAAIEPAKVDIAVDESGDAGIWEAVRDRAHPFFGRNDVITRLSLPRGARFDDDDALIEWGGTQAWIAGEPRSLAANVYAETFRRDGDGWTTSRPPVDGTVAKYVERVRHAFDPDGVFVGAGSG
ncbi:MAG: glycolate oxidase subunit GlcE [Gammaproteobacteria bacterium]|nr:glycolate oxidase subunit GlcE [Gammaproteobacteria bacterium]